MAAIALFRGPYHVMEWCNEENLALMIRDGRGIPVREAFPEPEYEAIQAAMDGVYRSGTVTQLALSTGDLLIGPRSDDRGRVFGVRTWFRLAPVPLGAPRHPSPARPLSVGPGQQAS